MQEQTWWRVIGAMIAGLLLLAGISAQENPDGFPTPELVVLPGTFQDELGCAGEWQPDCQATALSFDDERGLWTETFTIAAGLYEYKVALDGSWDRNYGQDGAANGANILLELPGESEVTFAYDHSNGTVAADIVTTGPIAVSETSLQRLSGYWLTPETFAWRIDPNPDERYYLVYSQTAMLDFENGNLAGDFEWFELEPNADGLSADVLDKFPHLEGLTAFTLTSDVDRVPEFLRGQIGLVAVDAVEGFLTNATGLQIPGVLDELYTTDAPLGVTFTDDVPTVSVWAPTAQTVSLNIYDTSDPDDTATVYEMTRDDETGVWSVTGDADWYGKFYTFNVTVFIPRDLEIVTNDVTDPYAVSLSQNSTRSQIIDLSDDSTLKPEGWDALVKAGITPEDITVYELHLRDYSIFDASVPEDLRGTYMAFTVADSDGRAHLEALADAGLTHLHLLPTFDIATINENRERHFAPDYDEFLGLPVDSEIPQETINPIRDLDGFNWGYDPYHFMAVEGSYATDADGAQRILEYREMVQALDEMGLRVAQDVVFNHTNASGQGTRSVLDRVVPGYYHRLNGSGAVEQSTCCQNTATEHNMMRRLMVDTVIMNVIDYKIDAFRFDLMGHHMLEDMIAVRAALDELTLDEHGVDGAAVYLYGEGWDFGEVANSARGVNATQFNAAGTGIGTFNDRLRDAVRGGSPFGGRDEQGFGNGIFTDPNAMNDVNTDIDRALRFADTVRVGLAGNLSDYTFVGSDGETIDGTQVDYNGSPVAYTTDPQENVIYVSKHDNETLFDNLVYRVPADTTIEELVRMQNFSLSTVMYAQGVPFFHAGSDMLRSKSLDRNSYNSGDWFNALDWTYASNNFGIGLPPAADNQERWDRMREILNNDEWYPEQDDIRLNVDVFREMLQVRYSSPLFRLQTAVDVQARVQFFNTGADQLPNVIVMGLSDLEGENIDPDHQYVLVVFNGQDVEIDYPLADLNLDLVLHPVLQESADDVVRSASYDAETQTVTVPAMTTAVFVVTE
jgi:pullulanase